MTRDGLQQVVSFAAPDVFRRIAERVTPTLDVEALDVAVVPPFGDHSLNVWPVTPDVLQSSRAAAVLVGLVVRDDGVHVLLTERTADLRSHAGQIAFPGGKIDAEDAGPAAAATREAYEEIGLPRSCIEILGYLGGYLTRSGYRIIPVVARIDPPFTLQLNPREVVSAFEVPFDHLMRDVAFSKREREWQGITRYFYSIEFGERTIWGATAGILRVLFDRLYG